MAPLEWADMISDWRWVSAANELYAPNPNWFSQLPKKFADIISLKDNNCAALVQEYLAGYLLAPENEFITNKRYRATVLFAMEYEEVRVYHIHNLYKLCVVIHILTF